MKKRDIEYLENLNKELNDSRLNYILKREKTKKKNYCNPSWCLKECECSLKWCHSCSFVDC